MCQVYSHRNEWLQKVTRGHWYIPTVLFLFFLLAWKHLSLWLLAVVAICTNLCPAVFCVNTCILAMSLCYSNTSRGSPHRSVSGKQQPVKTAFCPLHKHVWLLPWSCLQSLTVGRANRSDCRKLKLSNLLNWNENSLIAFIFILLIVNIF